MADSENELVLLEEVEERSPVSIYDLAEVLEKRKVDSESVISLVYYLAGCRLLELDVEEDEDGVVTIVKSTPLTGVHVRRKRG